MTDEKPAVKVGQVWKDNDKRARGRQVRIKEVGPTHAVVSPVGAAGRDTRIRLDRFRPNSTGYLLVADADR